MNDKPSAAGDRTEAVEEVESVTPPEVVARIQATPPNPTGVRPATANLADLLLAEAADPDFDRTDWHRQWATVEAEMKAVTRANDLAESRAG